MSKDEILAKSRNEHKDQDVFEKEVLKEAGNVGAITATILCIIFFIVQILVGGGTNYGFWAIAFSVFAASFTVKAIRLGRKHEIVIAVMYIGLTILSSVAFFYAMAFSSTGM